MRKVVEAIGERLMSLGRGLRHQYLDRYTPLREKAIDLLKGVIFSLGKKLAG